MPFCSQAPAAAPLLPSLPGQWLCSCPCPRAKLPVSVGRGACGAAARPDGDLAPAKRLSRRDIVGKGAGLVVLQDNIVCQSFVGGSLADAGRKTNCKDGKRRRKKKCAKGSGAGAEDQELLVSEGQSNTETETNLNTTRQTASRPASGSPLSSLTCAVLHPPGQPAPGQGTRDLGRRWDSPPTPELL